MSNLNPYGWALLILGVMGMGINIGKFKTEKTTTYAGLISLFIIMKALGII